MTKIEEFQVWIILNTPFIFTFSIVLEYLLKRIFDYNYYYSLIYLGISVFIFGLVGILTHRYITHPKIKVIEIIKCFLFQDLKKYKSLLYVRKDTIYTVFGNLGIIVMGVIACIIQLYKL